MNRNGSIVASFRNAFKGILFIFLQERNSKIHLAASLLALALGFLLKISISSWTAIIIVIALVWSLELINTSIEKLCDVLHPDRSEGIRLVKDLSAGAVLITAIGSIVVGFLVFLPPLIDNIWYLFHYK